MNCFYMEIHGDQCGTDEAYAEVADATESVRPVCLYHLHLEVEQMGAQLIVRRLP